MQLVEVEVMRLGLDRSTNSYVVILQEKGGARLLPIWIGQPEAESIVIEMAVAGTATSSLMNASEAQSSVNRSMSTLVPSAA